MTRKIKYAVFKKEKAFTIIIISTLCIFNGLSLCHSWWGTTASNIEVIACLAVSPISRNLKRVSQSKSYHTLFCTLGRIRMDHDRLR
jgi:hypothetical protein